MTPKNGGRWFTVRVTAVRNWFLHLTPESPKIGGEDEPTQFDDPIFSNWGWFNHQLGIDPFSWMRFWFLVGYYTLFLIVFGKPSDSK